MAATPAGFFQKLPPELDGWKKQSQYTVYTPANLSNYIDGGAELYNSYNFQNLLAVKYTRGTDEEIAIDLFEMGNSADAFGVFAHSRETMDSRIGQECEYSSGLLTFWQDRYYVSILTFPETKDKKETVLKLGALIAREIGRKGARPAITGLLPPAGLVPESVRYFHHYIWLNSYHYISDRNILNIDGRTPAAFGQYREPAGKFFLLLIEYPGAAQAEAARQSFLKTYLAGAAGGVKKMSDGLYSGCRQRNNLLIIVLKAPRAEIAEEMTARIAASEK